MAADAGTAVITPEHHRHGVPAVDVFDAPLDLDVAGVGGLLFERDGVAIGGVQRRILDDDVGIGEVVADGAEQLLGPVWTLRSQHGVDRFQPFLQFQVVVYEIRPSHRHESLSGIRAGEAPSVTARE